MTVGYDFAGDTNETLKRVQRDCYGAKVEQLFNAAWRRYINACRFIEVETEFFRQLVKIRTYDGKALRGAHDKIAAYYRFAHDDGGQMTLFPLERPIRTVLYDSEKASYEEKRLWKWSQFYNEEVEKLIEDDDIALAILTAVVYENHPKGRKAQELLVSLLDERYGKLVIKDSEDDL
jgi:hypothetical protein